MIFGRSLSIITRDDTLMEMLAKHTKVTSKHMILDRCPSARLRAASFEAYTLDEYVELSASYVTC